MTLGRALATPRRCRGSEAQVPALTGTSSSSWKWSGHCPYEGLWDVTAEQGCKLGLADPTTSTVQDRVVSSGVPKSTLSHILESQ